MILIVTMIILILMISLTIFNHTSGKTYETYMLYGGKLWQALNLAKCMAPKLYIALACPTNKFGDLNADHQNHCQIKASFYEPAITFTRIHTHTHYNTKVIIG